MNIDEQSWKGKRVALVSNNFEYSVADKNHPLNWLYARGARVYVVVRSTASTYQLFKNSPYVEGLIELNTSGGIAGVLKVLRKERFDAAILHLSLLHLEQYIPHVLCFTLINADKKIVIKKGNDSFQTVPLSTFYSKFSACMFQYVPLIFSKPFIQLRTKARSREKILPSHVHAILIIILDQIGNAAMASSLIDPLRALYPDAPIDLLLGPDDATLFKHDTRTRKTIHFKESWHTRHLKLPKNATPFKIFNAYIQPLLQKEHYTIAIDTRGDLYDSWAAYSSGARYTIGTVSPFYNSGFMSNRFLLTHEIPYGSELHPLLLQYAKTVEFLGYKGDTLQPRLMWNADDEKNADAALAELSITSTALKIGVHMSSRDVTRCWPTRLYVEAFTAIAAQKTNVVFVLVGSPDEYAENEKVREALAQNGVSAVNIAGKTSLLGTVALFSKMDLFVGNDSGPMHLAVAAGIPVVTLFLPVLSRVHAPLGTRHRVLVAHNEGGIETISPVEVTSAVLEQLAIK